MVIIFQIADMLCPLILTDRQYSYKHVANITENYIIMEVEAFL